MSIRKHYDEALAELNQALTEMGQAVTDAVENAMEALATTDAEAAAQIIKDDSQINEMEHDIEHRCMLLLLRQQPVAGDLRRVSATLKVITDLERIGAHPPATAAGAPNNKIPHANAAAAPTRGVTATQTGLTLEGRKEKSSLDPWEYGVISEDL